jgi:TctA family transporter
MLSLAINFAKHFVKLVPKNNQVLSIAVFVLLSVVVYAVADNQSGYGFFNLLLFFASTGIVIVWPKINFLPFIFWMVIGDIWLANFYRTLQIYGITG